MDSETRLAHVAIAVEDLQAAISIYASILGGQEPDREQVDSEGVDIAFFDLGGARLELMAPTAPDTPVGRFLSRHGPGLHHVAIEVRDLDAALERCRTEGMQPAGAAPREGSGGRRIAFLHPAGTGGVLIELVERAS